MRHRSIWLFILLGSILVFLLAVPLAALVWRAASANFMVSLVAPTAFSAFKISLTTSAVSKLIVIVTGTRTLPLGIPDYPRNGSLTKKEHGASPVVPLVDGADG